MLGPTSHIQVFKSHGWLMASVLYSPDREHLRNHRMFQWMAPIQGANRPRVSESRKCRGDRRRGDGEVTLRGWSGEGFLGRGPGRCHLSDGHHGDERSRGCWKGHSGHRGQGPEHKEPPISKAVVPLYVPPAVREGRCVCILCQHLPVFLILAIPLGMKVSHSGFDLHFPWPIFPCTCVTIVSLLRLCRSFVHP